MSRKPKKVGTKNASWKRVWSFGNFNFKKNGFAILKIMNKNVPNSIGNKSKIWWANAPNKNPKLISNLEIDDPLLVDWNAKDAKSCW